MGFLWSEVIRNPGGKAGVFHGVSVRIVLRFFSAGPAKVSGFFVFTPEGFSRSWAGSGGRKTVGLDECGRPSAARHCIAHSSGIEGDAEPGSRLTGYHHPEIRQPVPFFVFHFGM